MTLYSCTSYSAGKKNITVGTSQLGHHKQFGADCTVVFRNTVCVLQLVYLTSKRQIKYSQFKHQGSNENRILDYIVFILSKWTQFMLVYL